MKKLILIFLLIISTGTLRSQNVTLNIRALIQGYYQGSGTMVAVIDPVNFPDICDTLTVKLVDTSATSYHVLYSSTSTISTTGYGIFDFPDSVLGGTYVIQLVHRNALTVFSNHAVIFNDVIMWYDFTVLPIQFCESGINSGDGYALMCSGDMNQDGDIDLGDFSIWDSANVNFAHGYEVADLNGDGEVDTLDYIFWDTNNFNFATSVYPNDCIALGVTATSVVKQNTLNIYPNPTNGVLHISFKNIGSGEVNVFNILGENIYTEEITPQQSSELQLNLHAPSGVYFIKVNDGDKQWASKLIKE